jgi:hypothetical protein
MNTKGKFKQLMQVRHIARCNGSKDVVKRCEYDLERLFYRRGDLKWIQ